MFNGWYNSAPATNTERWIAVNTPTHSSWADVRNRIALELAGSSYVYPPSSEFAGYIYQTPEVTRMGIFRVGTENKWELRWQMNAVFYEDGLIWDWFLFVDEATSHRWAYQYSSFRPDQPNPVERDWFIVLPEGWTEANVFVVGAVREFSTVVFSYPENWGVVAYPTTSFNEPWPVAPPWSTIGLQRYTY